nr:dCTP deaminase [Chitinophagaceae bacterium]
MILSDTRILEEIEKGTIIITPYDRECLGSNSYDVHLGKTLATYNDETIDAKKHNAITYFDIPDEGIILEPQKFYLGVTMEYTETHAHVPFLEGKSSTGRLGIDIHA